MALSTKEEAILHLQMSAQKIADAANVAYWLSRYEHEGIGHQLKTIGEEYGKVAAAMLALSAAGEAEQKRETRASALSDLAAADAELL